ncbi:MAG: YggS family pyridoxal phosphate-dependent enzyme [Verrucomicrobiota bacterium]|nr:YggS family pyridoxal phosphate-dependent enzyme [Verrucomicrobiota bacterium]
MANLADRLDHVRSTLTEAAARAGRVVADIEVVAVSKTHSPETVKEAIDAGQLLFGESRIQEARAKIPLLPARARWHFIGHLQRNKARHALPLFELLHGIDTLELARDLNRVAGEMGSFPKVLLEVNVAGESTKFGFPHGRLSAGMDELLALDRLQIEGLMTIAPFAPEPESSRKYFAALRNLRDRLQDEFRTPLPRLSMGMSSDYAVAVEEGATLVRIGTAIFGGRSGKGWRPSSGAGFEE